MARRAGLAISLVVLCGWVYRPALSRLFAGDQVYYFAELNGDRSLAAGLSHWDYALSRQFNKGDELLFRPLLFVLLAVENWLFGYDYYAWNVVNLCLHLVVCYLLYELLRSLTNSLLAELAVLLFAVNRAVVDLVAWNHLGGYLLGYSCMLLALLAAKRSVDIGADEPKRWQRAVWLLLYSFAATLATGCHEIAVVMALLGVIYLGWGLRQTMGKARWLVWTSSGLPILIYGSLYAWHASRATHLFWTDHGESRGPLVWAGRTIGILCQWSAAAIDPWHSWPATPPNSTIFDPSSGTNCLSFSITGALGLVILGCCLSSAISRSKLIQQGPFLVFLLLLVAGYAAMNCVGRKYTSPYYQHFFCLLGTGLGFAFFDLARLGKWRRFALSVGLLILIANNVWASSEFCVRIERDNGPIGAWFQMVSDHVARNCHDPNFSFATENIPEQVDPIVDVYVGYPSASLKCQSIPMTGMLFRKYYDPANPLQRLNVKINRQD